MSIKKQACSLVIKSSAKKSKNKIFVLDMGKPIKILDLIYKLNSIYGENDLSIREIGLSKGEKLKDEDLSHNKKIFKSKVKDILYIKDKSIEKNEIQNLINNLKDNIDNRNYNHLNKIKSFLNK